MGGDEKRCIIRRLLFTHVKPKQSVDHHIPTRNQGLWASKSTLSVQDPGLLAACLGLDLSACRVLTQAAIGQNELRVYVGRQAVI